MACHLDVIFILDEVTLKQVIPRFFSFPLLINIPPLLHTHVFPLLET
jgi:hypothetical protein